MTERPYDPVPIGKVLDEQSRRFGMGGAEQVAKVFSSWPRIVGDAVATHVRPVSLRNGTLKLVADSPAWTTEINYLRDQIRSRANELLGGPVVMKIQVRAGKRDEVTSAASVATTDASGHSPVEERERPSADDPMTAFERARAAWARRRSGRR